MTSSLTFTRASSLARSRRVSKGRKVKKRKPRRGRRDRLQGGAHQKKAKEDSLPTPPEVTKEVGDSIPKVAILSTPISSNSAVETLGTSLAILLAEEVKERRK